jgi:hypothetical protein
MIAMDQKSLVRRDSVTSELWGGLLSPKIIARSAQSWATIHWRGVYFGVIWPNQ